MTLSYLYGLLAGKPSATELAARWLEYRMFEWRQPMAWHHGHLRRMRAHLTRAVLTFGQCVRYMSDWQR